MSYIFFMHDQTDSSILAELQKNAWMAQGAIAKREGLSEGAVSQRIAKMKKEGLIRRVTAVLDDAKVGCDIQAFVEVFVEPARHETAFLEAMHNEPEVLEVHHITGEFSVLLKVKTKNRDTL